MRKSAFYILTLFTLLFTTACEEEVELVKIKTEFGEMLVYLYDATPKHKANFLKLAKEGYFNGTTFHRVVPNFVIQGGDPNSRDTDPNNDGMGGPDYKIDAEIKPNLKHKYAALGAARDGNPEKASSGSQFYIVMNQNGTPHLDGGYTVFGEVVKGMEVAEAIGKETRQGERPQKNITMQVEVVKIKPSKLAKEHWGRILEIQAQ